MTYFSSSRVENDSSDDAIEGLSGLELHYRYFQSDTVII